MPKVLYLFPEEMALAQLGFEALLVEAAKNHLQSLQVLFYGRRKDNDIIQIKED